MRREVEIYINTAGFGETVTYKRLDIFSEESINITNSIQDIRDIAKVFTDYSQQFSLPASSPNNLIFKHYYNFDIIGGYDARVKREALIKINGEDYKKGFLSLNSVSMKNGVAFAYKAVFYGKTVNLNLLFGDDELDDLASYSDAYLSQFNQLYTASVAQIGFTDGYNLVSGSLQVNNSGSTAGDLCYPFISGNSHYYYDSQHSVGPPLREDVVSRNVATSSGSTQHPAGISLIDLKPAIRLYHIILGIEDKYGITFSKNGTNDFFSTSNASFYELYLWLHREKGDLSSQISIASFELFLNQYTFATGSSDPRSNSNTELVASYEYEEGTGDEIETYYEYVINVTPSGTGVYTLELFDSVSGEVIGTSEHSGDGIAVSRTFTLRKDAFSGFGTQVFKPVLRVKAKDTNISAIQINGLTINVVIEDQDGPSGGYAATYTFNNGGSNNIYVELNVVDNMPKMKVIDFLTSIFKMFNLTAFYDGETIKVRTLDKFYEEGTSYDVSQYIHADKHTVDKANIYSKIDFEYQEASTFAIVNSNEITNDEFGNERLNNSSTSISNPLAFDGGTYTVKLGFEHVMYERMTDQEDDTDTTVQWGWMASKDQNPILGKPLVFYCIKSDTDTIYTTGGDDLDQYIRPANTLTTTSTTKLQTIHFGEETDEYFAEINSNSLFNNYYFNYIVPIYNEKSRLSKFEATLPLRLVTKLELNDKLIVSGRSYKINRIQMNINTGKATLELINEV